MNRMTSLLLFILVAGASGFMATMPWGTAAKVSSQSQQSVHFMFSKHDGRSTSPAEIQPLQEVSPNELSSLTEAEATRPFVPSRESGKLEISWWAYALFGLPFIRAANDFLHFVPKEGPWANFFYGS